MTDSELGAFDALAKHARLSDLVAITRAIATSAAEAGTELWHDGAKVHALAEEVELTHEEAATPYGNALDVLDRGPEDPSERALARALFAHVVAENPPRGREAEDRLATDILWLSTRTPFDATRLLDRALGDAAPELWEAIAGRIRRVDQGRIGVLGRGDALVGGAAMAESTEPATQKIAAKLAAEVRDPALARVLSLRAPVVEETLRGELGLTPRGPVATTALACTGILFAMHAVRLVARVALSYRRPAELTLSATGIHVHAKTQLLGRTIREHDFVILRSALHRATRDVRFPHLAFYVGLIALALGSYLGVATLIDGARAASPSLLLTGILIIAAGVLLEMVLGSIEPGVAGKCRVVLVPARGRRLCVTHVKPEQADAALGLLARPR